MNDDKRMFDRGLALRLLDNEPERKELIDSVMSLWPYIRDSDPDDFYTGGGDARFCAILRELAERNPGDVYRAEVPERDGRAAWRECVNVSPVAHLAGKLPERWSGEVVVYKTPKSCTVRCVAVHNAAKLAIAECMMPRVSRQKAADEREYRERLEAEYARRRETAAAEAAAKAKREAAKREAAARRRGTQGIQFAGASCRFKDSGRDVFLIRADLRSTLVDAGGLCLTDSSGATWRPEVKDADDALAQVLDWRWRGAAEWAESQHGADYRERGTLGEFESWRRPAKPGTFAID